ncbi:hypothetical protein F1559_001321 [Cyanidiococcus yangmingshanensis]|uniref:E3 ubiquitin ligase UBR4 C-terminal domain-containing protein n=1 Tax=Cyanidiococcus yangmingshanensis TaxID=2690220 RepID=A0A7J7IJB4_9RHOD|nr:hypothetical protein F1559_001321 [Cyanidiococcus yangmingshanensis]
MSSSKCRSISNAQTARSLEALFALYSLQVWEASTPGSFLSATSEQRLASRFSDERRYTNSEQSLDAFEFEFRKAPTQEDYIRGSLAGQRFRLATIGDTCRQAGLSVPSHDPSVWSMRLIKDFICLQLDLESLLNDDFAMELLVDGLLVPLSMHLGQVFSAKKCSASSLVVVVVVAVTYRLAGLDGEATEALFPAARKATANAETTPQRAVQCWRMPQERLLRSFVEYGGLEQLIQLVPRAPSVAIRQLKEHLAIIEAVGEANDSDTTSALDEMSRAPLDPAQARHLFDQGCLVAAQMALLDTTEHVRAANQLLELLVGQAALVGSIQQGLCHSIYSSRVYDHAERLLRDGSGLHRKQGAEDTRSRSSAAHSTIEIATKEERERLYLRLLARFVDASSILAVLDLSFTALVNLAPESWPCRPFKQLVEILGFLPRPDLWCELDTKGLLPICERALEHLIPLILSRTTLPVTANTPTMHSTESTMTALVEQVIHLLQQAFASAPESLRSHWRMFPSQLALADGLIRLARQPSALGNTTEDLNEIIRAEPSPGAQRLLQAERRFAQARREAARQARERAQAAIQRQVEVVSRPSLAPDTATISEAELAPGTCVYCRETNASHPDDPLCAYVVLTPHDLATEWNLVSRCCSPLFQAEDLAIEPLWTFAIQTAFHLVHEQCHRRACRVDARVIANYLGVSPACSRGAANASSVRCLALFPLYLHGDTTAYATLLRNAWLSFEGMHPSHPLYPSGRLLNHTTSPLLLRARLLASLTVFFYQLVPGTTTKTDPWDQTSAQSAPEGSATPKTRNGLPGEAALALLPHWVAAILYLSRRVPSSRERSDVNSDDDLISSQSIGLLEWELVQSCTLDTDCHRLFASLMRLGSSPAATNTASKHGHCDRSSASEERPRIVICINGWLAV